MATWAVLNNNDIGAGSLRATVASAQAGDTINLGDVYDILLKSGPITLDKDLTIVGAGRRLYGDYNGGRVFNVTAGVNVRIENVALTGGRKLDDGGVIHSAGALTLHRVSVYDNVARHRGGAIYQVGGSLTITDSTIENNRVARDDAAGISVSGGALYVDGAAISISGSTFVNNVADGGTVSGAGVWRGATGGAMTLANAPSVSIVNCTIVDNRAQGASNTVAEGTNAAGGAIAFSVCSNVDIINCTIYRNTALSGAGAAGFTSNSFGGGIAAGDDIPRLINTVVAYNISDVSKQISAYQGVTGGGNVMAGANGGALAGFTNGVNGNRVDVPLILGELAYNGGPMKTVAALSTELRDAGIVADGVPAFDQRGARRDATPDVGAIEAVTPTAGFGRALML
ncbi:MAG: hypothetical protein QOF78_1048, partial [Phycisphaerales bacterium]|nr:hypothetical protein [Phycisphaerales bacterium]